MAGRTLDNLQKGFRSVVDVPDHLWDAAAKGWREAADHQFQMDTQRAELERQASRPVVEGARRAGQVVSALLGDTQHDASPEVGFVDRGVIDRRMRQTQADIQGGLDAARASGYLEASAGAWPGAGATWFDRVRHEGSWDDRTAYEKAHPGTTGQNPLERQGNFSYGATAAALGVPKEVALRAAGVVQRLGNVGRALNGKLPINSVGLFQAPYGDDPRDQVPIAEGYAYGQSRLGARRR